jgi:hypothetical protein
MNPYPWLHVGEDGSIRADLQDCTGAEMDRRLVIMQEIEAGRVVVAGEVERLRQQIAAARELLLEFQAADCGPNGLPITQALRALTP